MTDFIPPTAHEEIDFLDEVEREMMVLTTAELEGLANDANTPAAPLATTLKTVISAQAAGHMPGPHTPRDNNDENIVIATPSGHGSRPSPG